MLEAQLHLASIWSWMSQLSTLTMVRPEPVPPSTMSCGHHMLREALGAPTDSAATKSRMSLRSSTLSVEPASNEEPVQSMVPVKDEVTQEPASPPPLP